MGASPSHHTTAAVHGGPLDASLRHASPRNHVRDRLTGEDVWLGETDRLTDWLGDSVAVYPDDLPELTQRLVVLPDLELLELRQGVFLSARLGPTRWLAWRNPSSTLIFDSTTGETEVLFDRFGNFWLHGDRLDILLHGAAESERLTSEGELHAAWVDDRSSERIAHRATSGYLRLADGRVATPLEVDEGDVGTLALTDADGITRWALDTDVVGWFAKYQASAGYDDDVLLYSASRGEGSGVWLARLPMP